MPISATGTRRVPRPRGFSLLELLVVVAIAGLLAALAMLSLGGLGAPDPVRQAERLADQVALVAEEIAFSGRTIGLRLDPEGTLQFVALTLPDGEREPRWQTIADDPLLRPIALGERFEVELTASGARTDPRRASPAVLLMPDGTSTPFELRLTAGARYALLRGPGDGSLAIETGER